MSVIPPASQKANTKSFIKAFYLLFCIFMSGSDVGPASSLASGAAGCRMLLVKVLTSWNCRTSGSWWEMKTVFGFQRREIALRASAIKRNGEGKNVVEFSSFGMETREATSIHMCAPWPPLNACFPSFTHTVAGRQLRDMASILGIWIFFFFWYPEVIQLPISDTDINQDKPILIYADMKLSQHG